jgi:hypothetical protein
MVIHVKRLTTIVSPIKKYKNQRRYLVEPLRFLIVSKDHIRNPALSCKSTGCALGAGRKRITYNRLNIRMMNEVRPHMDVRAPDMCQLSGRVNWTSGSSVPKGSAMNSHSIDFTLKVSLK